MMKNKKSTIIIVVVALLAVGGAGLFAMLNSNSADQVAAKEQSATEPLMLGSEDAPILLEEFTSLTCPHCRSYHADVLPTIKKLYVDTGKLRIRIYDFPLDQLAAAAAALPRCVSTERREKVLELLLDQQANWAVQDDPVGKLAEVAALVGLDRQAFDSCLTNTEIQSKILAERKLGVEGFGVQGTPALFVQGRKVMGYHLETLVKAIEDAL